MDIIHFYLGPTGNSVKELNFPESGNRGNQLGMTVSTEDFFQGIPLPADSFNI